MKSAIVSQSDAEIINTLNDIAKFNNVKAILEDAGSSWEQLVDVQVFLTNMDDDFKTYNRLYSEYFEGINPKPCRTTCAITALPTPIAIELKCIATIED